jgi:hypothetical protein
MQPGRREIRVCGALAGVLVLLTAGPVLPAALAASSSQSATAAAPASSAPAIPVPSTGSNALSPGLPVSPTPSTSAAPTVVQNASTSTSGASGLSGSSALFIAIGAIVVLGGISFFIWRDARRRAPARGGEGYEIRRSGSKPPPKPRKLSPAERRRRKRGRARR